MSDSTLQRVLNAVSNWYNVAEGGPKDEAATKELMKAWEARSFSHPPLPCFYVYETDYPEDGGDTFFAKDEEAAKRAYIKMTGTDTPLGHLDAVLVEPPCPCCGHFDITEQLVAPDPDPVDPSAFGGLLPIGISYPSHKLTRKMVGRHHDEQ